MLRKSMREFVDKEIKGEYARDLDDDLSKMFIDESMWQKIKDLGIFAASVPEEYGGLGGSIIDDVIISEEFARGSTAVAMSFGATTGFGARSILFGGTEEQKRLYLPQIAEGEIKFAMAVTEPAGGTDLLGAITTTARPEGDHFIVSGQKIYITNAHMADYILTLVRTDETTRKKSKSLTLFLMPVKDNPGVKIVPMKKFTIKGASACEVFFDNAKVPAENMVGELHNGWYVLLKTLNHERIIVAALTNGIGQAALEDMVAYAKKREAFGRPIGQYQSIQHKIADTAMELELAKLITYKAAWLLEAGKPCHMEAVMAKVFSSEMAFKAGTRGLDIFAGYGVTLECDMQRYFRDSRQCTFSPISNEMARNFIAEQFGLPKSY
ncbi:MAG: acyl-CoA/acyl-ACP dehydrogenase [Deltaproteobacteria bacterium]|nr:acyl-CoA/acyl-ACP dehydrogenase [Deltaproteobacteria bacterium]